MEKQGVPAERSSISSGQGRRSHHRARLMLDSLIEKNESGEIRGKEEGPRKSEKADT